MSGLIAGVVLLDIGVQSGHVSNQTRIYGLQSDARSRMNMVYMVCYFSAGALGSYAGSVLWHWFGWAGVCGLGCGLLVAGAWYIFFPGCRVGRRTRTGTENYCPSIRQDRKVEQAEGWQRRALVVLRFTRYNRPVNLDDTIVASPLRRDAGGLESFALPARERARLPSLCCG